MANAICITSTIEDWADALTGSARIEWKSGRKSEGWKSHTQPKMKFQSDAEANILHSLPGDDSVHRRRPASHMQMQCKHHHDVVAFN